MLILSVVHFQRIFLTMFLVKIYTFLCTFSYLLHVLSCYLGFEIIFFLRFHCKDLMTVHILFLILSNLFVT